jgi:hypothetical protein
MAPIAIVPVESGQEPRAYHATSGGKHAQGKTAGQALDAIANQIPKEEAGTLVIVQNLFPDRFFNAAQQARLAERLTRWRTARDRGNNLSGDAQAELEALVEAELAASAARVGAQADALGR